MKENEISLDVVPCGKYKGQLVEQMLRDRPYCRWFLSVADFEARYPHIYSAVRDFRPLEFFIDPARRSEGDFLTTFAYFNLVPPASMSVPLSETEQKCYTYYFTFIQEIKQTIKERLDAGHAPITAFNIAAPKQWLKNFEAQTGLDREQLKEFLGAYELPNATSIITEVKAQAGVEYKGGQTFKIARANSKAQELFWQEILTEKFGNDICCQFNFQKVYEDVALETCIFDFINIRQKRVYECKLGLKDFNKRQYEKYVSSLGSSFKFFFLIDRDCVFDVSSARIYVIDKNKFDQYIQAMLRRKAKLNELEKLACESVVVQVNDISKYL